MATVLVTGASGFVGRHLVPLLAARGDAVTASGRGSAPAWLPVGVAWTKADLLVTAAPLARAYDGIVHLAAETVPSRFDTARPVVDNLAMLLALTDHLVSGRLLFVSSCHVYAPGGGARREDDPVRPQGRYGLSKHLGEQAALAATHLDVRVARPFNHLGTGMPADLAVPSIVRRVRALDDGPLVMHGLDSTRDFLDVADIARAYLALLDLDRPANRVFNVCSGTAAMIGEVARAALAATGRQAEVVFANHPLSQDDTTRLVGDPTRLMVATGWRPRSRWQDSVAALAGG